MRNFFIIALLIILLNRCAWLATQCKSCLPESSSKKNLFLLLPLALVGTNQEEEKAEANEDVPIGTWGMSQWGNAKWSE
ncbi:MAG: hypothetical protein H7A23_06565 [Leptospiraceae bacterium]|nr:hypothetical protein [Leptospiraceae bacterium]MCP5494202.1 hypothetical protein [Leptospiraceae bacterium]